MEREAAAAAYSRLHADAPYHDGSWADWSDKQSASHPYGYNDGVKFGVAVRDLAPDDKFTTDVNARPA